MLSMKINIFYIVLINILVKIQSLVEISTVEDNSIRIAATVIQNTVKQMFNALNIRDIDLRVKLQQLFTLHKYFLSVTLTDCNNLKKIVGLLKVYNIDNNTNYLITKINEVLNEDYKSSESNGSEKHVEIYIETFINKLKHLKKKYIPNRLEVVNAKIFKYLQGNETVNVTINKKMEARHAEVLDVNDDDEYWKPSGRRLFRGFRTRIKKFPFMASVQFFRKFQCAGSIIKSDLVITSASCLQLPWNNRFFRENPAFLSVNVGSDYYEHGGDNIAVQEIYFYPAYNPKTLQNNLAIMRLSRRIAFKKKHKRVRKIDIDRNPSKWVPSPGSDIITVVGWGARDSSNVIYNILKNKLSYAELDYYPLSECRKHYSRAYVTKRNFCAGFFSKGGGACNRDAGGPAIIDGILMGVISFGAPVCGSPDSPTVFTKLGFYADWIDEILEQEVPYTYQKTTTPTPLLKIVTEKLTSTTIRFVPITRTKRSYKYAAPMIPQRLGYNDLLSSELDSRVKSESKEIKLASDSETNKHQEKLTTHTDKLTAIIPVMSISEAEKESEFTESDEDDVNELSIETGTDIAKKVTVLENLNDGQTMRSITNAKNEAKREQSQNSENNNNNVKRPSPTEFLTASYEKNDQGLSIPTASFHNLSRIIPTTHVNDRVSESRLFDIMAQAIEEEVKILLKEKTW